MCDARSIAPADFMDSSKGASVILVLVCVWDVCASMAERVGNLIIGMPFTKPGYVLPFFLVIPLHLVLCWSFDQKDMLCVSMLWEELRERQNQDKRIVFY